MGRTLTRMDLRIDEAAKRNKNPSATSSLCEAVPECSNDDSDESTDMRETIVKVRYERRRRSSSCSISRTDGDSGFRKRKGPSQQKEADGGRSKMAQRRSRIR